MKFMFTIAAILFAQNVLAVTLPIESCRTAEPLNEYIVDRREFSNGQIRMFVHDVGEPAGAPVGLQIRYTRVTPRLENFCVYVTGLSDLSLKRAMAQYDESTNTLYVYAPGRRYSGNNGNFISTTAIIIVRKEGVGASNIFSATAN